MKKVAVGSGNPVKLGCTQKAFTSYWSGKKFEFVAEGVRSGVADQPMSDEECIKGAKHRAKKVLEKMKADFGVGIEGGIIKADGQYFARAWVAIVDWKETVG
ncbi:inosine/xanthosine triphosphatase, partial [Patescibacteria group bacterium]|nr:inosine/xanthosine triphosphatase [Patescibacteria group bacterium]